MKTSLCIIATNKYITFLPKLLASVKENFKPTEEIQVHVFTDRISDCKLILHQNDLPIFHEIEHKPWPFATAHRFHFFTQYLDQLDGDWIFYIDADTLITAPIGNEILSPFTVVQHCGYVNGGGTYETRIESRAYTPPELRGTYVGGGFFGMNRENFRTLIPIMVEATDEDTRNNITPIWQDESLLNALAATILYKKVLSPSYHYPQDNPRICDSWPEKYPCKILLLNKDHREFQV